MIQVLRFKGVASITVTDLHATRLEVARQLGAIAMPVNFMKTADLDHAFDLAIDATESPDAIRNLRRPARDGGKILLFGVCPPGVTVPYVPNEIYCRELTIVGSFSLNGEIEEALQLLSSGAIETTKTVSHRILLSDFPMFLRRIGEPDTLKVQVHFQTVN